VLTIVTMEWKAELITASLLNEGIGAKCTSALTAERRADVSGGARVLVYRDKYELSRRILRELRGARQDVDWSQIDVCEGEMREDR